MDSLVQRQRIRILDIARRYGVFNVRLFGSRARGDARPDSDVDLLVGLPDDFTLLRHASLERELSGLLGRRVEVVSEAALDARLRQSVLPEARPL